MTLYLNCRMGGVGGSIAEQPWILEGDGLVDKPKLEPSWTLDPRRLEGRHVVIATHGFNVSYRNGVRGLAALERDLALPKPQLFMGVLWPGDFWLPFINYPAEASDAVECGRKLAAFANTQLGPALSVSLLSHSLGARVVLEAARSMRRAPREICVTAAAADDDCLVTRYDDVRARTGRISVLASRKDWVLQLAYPIGDWGSDVIWRDPDSPWRGALGYHGPKPTRPSKVEPAQIPDHLGYRHEHYFPPVEPDPQAQANDVVRYMRARLLGEPCDWPPRAAA